MKNSFFDEPLSHSMVKGEIVSKYFPAWAKIILTGSPEYIGFVDLYSGPGKYDDGTASTPSLLIENAIKDKIIASKLICIFNDKVSDYINTLQQTLHNIDVHRIILSKSEFYSQEVSDDTVNILQKIKPHPTLHFFDPWGYKGLSLDLIKFAISHSWGSECLFFFNYNRINAAITNKIVEPHTMDLFGEDRLVKLRKQIDGMKPYKREETVINLFCEALGEIGGKFILPFCFKDQDKDKTSHYLIFIGKHPKGYMLIKEIMAKYSDSDVDGVPSFTYDPKPKAQLELTFNRPLVELETELSKRYKSSTLTVDEIYKKHQQETRFTKKNYKDALLSLEKADKIKVDVPASQRRQNKGLPSLGDDRTITFY